MLDDAIVCKRKSSNIGLPTFRPKFDSRYGLFDVIHGFVCSKLISICEWTCSKKWHWINCNKYSTMNCWYMRKLCSSPDKNHKNLYFIQWILSLPLMTSYDLMHKCSEAVRRSSKCQLYTLYTSVWILSGLQNRYTIYSLHKRRSA